jgi:surfeit locus 1 family protein
MSRLSPAGALLTLVAAGLVAAMAWLGLWQLGVYDDRQHDDAEAALDRPPLPLDDVIGPDEAFPDDGVGRRVTVAGTYVPGDQFYVRNLDGAAHTYAVVTPLLTASRSAVLVVRGSADVPEAPVPAGRIEVEGVLEPSTEQGAGLDSHRMTDGLRISALVSSMADDLYGGYVVATRSTPADLLQPVEPPPVEPSRWAGIRNLLYAIQWWVFAAFVVFMWWRILSDRLPDA